MKNLPLLCCLLLSPCLSFANTDRTTEIEKEDNSLQIHGRSETSLEWYEKVGGTTSSTYEGTSWRQELSVNIKKTLEDGSMGLNLRGRGTDNEQIDNRTARLLLLHGYRTTEKWDFEFGDVAASYNPFVLSAGTKGAKFNYRVGERNHGWDYSAFGGLQKATWENTYNVSADDDVDRYIAGLKTTWKHGPAQFISVTAAYIKDDDASGDDGDNIDVDINAAEATTAGLEWGWRFNRYITVKGLAGLTHTDDDTQDDEDAHDATAIRIKVQTKPIPRSVTSNFLYERFDTDYKPIVASATSDRERLENDTQWMVNRELKLRTTLKHSHDNIDGNQEGTLTTNDAVFYATYRPSWLKRGDLGFRTQLKNNEGRGTEQDFQIVEINGNYRPKGEWRYGTSFLATFIDDDTVGAEDQTVYTVRGTLGWKRVLLNDHVLRATVRLDGNFFDRDSGDQDALGGHLDLGYDAGRFWSFDLSLNSSNTYFDVSDDTQYNTYQLRVNYSPKGDNSSSFRFSAERREHNSDSDDDDVNYDEHLVKLAYLFSF